MLLVGALAAQRRQRDRADAAEFLELAAEIPVRTAVEAHPLEDANLALARLASGEVRGAAVLTTPR